MTWTVNVAYARCTPEFCFFVLVFFKAIFYFVLVFFLLSKFAWTTPSFCIFITFSMCVSKHGLSHVQPWLSEFSGVVFSCSTLSRLIVYADVSLSKHWTQLIQKILALLLIFHRFLSVNCCLSVFLKLDKGAYPENSHVVFCPNK